LYPYVLKIVIPALITTPTYFYICTMAKGVDKEAAKGYKRWAG
jgi:hypothetical protein